MKIYSKITGFLLLGFFLILSSCGKDETMTNSEPAFNPGASVNTFGSIKGLIFDSEDQIIEGATIVIGDYSTVSDENGYYGITGFFASDGQHIEVVKSGYYTGHGILLPLEDETLFVNITLLEKEPDSGGVTNTAIEYNTENASISFVANSFVDESGNVFNGPLTIATAYHNSFDEESNKYRIGELLTEDLTGSKIVESYGMLTVELYGASGQDLQINQAASISIKVPAEQLASAPSEIPLWYRDSETGLWVKEGKASLVGEFYVGEVSHFTDWLCGIEYEYYLLEGVVERDGGPYTRARVHFKMSNSSSSVVEASYTGKYRKVLSNRAEFDVEIYDRCDQLVHAELDQAIMTEDRILDMNVSGTSEWIEISGLVYCNDLSEPVVGAYVLVTIGGSISNMIPTFDADNGDPLDGFVAYIPDCSADEIGIVAYDPSTQTMSEPVALPGEDSVINLNVCEAPVTSSVTIHIEGEPDYVIPGCTLRIDTIGLNSTSADSSFLEWYYFETTDFFTGDPTVVGEQVEYEIIVITRFVPVGQWTDVPTIVPPNGPLNEPEASSGAPFYYEFIAVDYTTIFNNDDMVAFNIETASTSWGSSLKRIINGVEEDLTGTVTVQAMK